MPRYGFNHLWMYSVDQDSTPQPADVRALDFQRKHGLDFVRLPVDYRFWTKNFDYFHPNEALFEHVDRYFEACRTRGLHFSFNLHRAPGYCINGNHLEKHNLWTDEVAQDAFVFLWETFARRWKGIPSSQLSFDLLNEPPNVGQYGLTREIHSRLIRRTFAAIRAVDPQREVVINGLGGGNLAMPELADLDVVQSGRGYQPMSLTHYQASWCEETKGLPKPPYPNAPFAGKIWNKDTLREHYKPWLDLQKLGVRVHIGEFGCYNKVENELALRWFDDLLSLFQEWGWGYSLWNFQGDFGLVEHGRPGTRWELFEGYRFDKDLLELYLKYRV